MVHMSVMHFSLFSKGGHASKGWYIDPCLAVVKKIKEPILIGTAVLRKQIEELVKEPTLKCQFFASFLVRFQNLGTGDQLF
jgi:hypothetical protein